MSVTSDSSLSKVDNDETGDESFACSSVGCNQKFATANELAVHTQKHQMTLTLGPPKLPSLADVLPVDQTPTPTRFLHLGNKLGLFEELNPFDKEFKTAQKDGISSKQLRAAAVVQQLQALSNKNKSPSTPTRTTDGNSFSVSGPPLHVIAITPTLPSPVTGLSGGTGQFLVPPLLPSPQGLIPGLSATSPLQVPVNLLSPTLMPFPSGFVSGMPASFMADAQQRAAVLTQAMFAAAVPGSPSSAANSSYLTLASSQQGDNTEILANASASIVPTVAATQLTGSLSAASLVIPKQERPRSVTSVITEPNNFPDVSATTAQPNTLAMTESFNQGSEDMLLSSYPVVVQLPNGQTTCIGLSSGTATLSTNTLVASASTSLPSVSTLQHPIVNSQTNSAVHPTLGPRASSEFGSTSSLLEAKQKLKETLTSNNPNLQQQVTTTNQQTTLGLADSTVEAKPVRRRGRQSQDIDPDIKRQRFLERNRAAASRCRSKKKLWVNGLESKAKGLSQTNILLQNEIAALKDEVATLKQLLLSHRDCPITKMQQQNMALAGINLDPNASLPSVKAESSNNTASLHQSLSSTLSNNSMDDNLRSTQQSNATSSLVNGSLFLAMTSASS